MRIYGISLLISAAALTLSGCDRSADDIQTSAAAYTVTLVNSPGGNGDNGYNDLVLDGALRFYNSHSDIGFSLQRPEDTAEAAAILKSWLEETAEREGESLLILASDYYRSLFDNTDYTLGANQHILLFESEEADLPANVSTFRICRYGVSYLAGTIAGETPEAHIVAATDTPGLMHDAVSGFKDGYLDASGREAEVHFLSDSEDGYSMPNAAYELARDLYESFIFPLAGGSNSGIFKYTREDEFTPLLVSGMDVDCSEYSTRVPFSVLVHIDNVIYSMLSEWHQTGKLPPHTDFNLKDSETVEIKTNPLFLERALIFQDYYSENDYWQKRLDLNYKKACDKESQYYD